MLLYSPSKCSFTLSKLIRNARFFLLAARHRMQALSALACCVGCAFSGFASLKTALFIQLLTNEGASRGTLVYCLCYSLLFFVEEPFLLDLSIKRVLIVSGMSVLSITPLNLSASSPMAKSGTNVPEWLPLAQEMSA